MFALCKTILPWLLLCHGSLAFALEPRLWLDSQGRKVQATYVRSEGKNVILKLTDGRELPFPLEKLAAADRSYIAKNSAEATRESERNFDAPWPERISFAEDPEIQIIEENVVQSRFIYESANYRYTSDVRLAASLVKGFAVMFEATHLYCRTLPLSLRSDRRVAGKYKILLFKDEADYIKAGGLDGSAGVFMSDTGIVMIPLTSLGVRPLGSGYILNRDKSSKTIPHELTHQLTPDAYFKKGALGWFSEGIAEYVASTPYRSGSYNIRGNLDDIIELATGYGKKGMGGRALGEKISLPPLKDFMLQDYRSFIKDGQFNYGVALLITTYFLAMDGEGDARRMKTYLAALLEEKDAEMSLDLLLDGRTFEELQKDITRAWGSKGIDLFFSK